jgi:hypothetical protein
MHRATPPEVTCRIAMSTADRRDGGSGDQNDTVTLSEQVVVPVSQTW